VLCYKGILKDSVPQFVGFEYAARYNRIWVDRAMGFADSKIVTGPAGRVVLFERTIEIQHSLAGAELT
jgi:hypothetical protein